MLTAAILLLLVGQVSAVIKCVQGDGTEAAADCAAEVTACYTHTATDSGTGTTTITYGCGDGTDGTDGSGTDDCDKDTGKCVFCYTERAAGCNKDDADPDLYCFKSADNATSVCVTPVTSCFTRKKVADDKVVEKGCGDPGTDSTGTWGDAVTCPTDKCNADFFCFEDTGALSGSASTCPVDSDGNAVEKCYTKTETDNKGVKTVTRGCGACAGTEVECPKDSSTCTSNEINGCNEPERKDFTCVQKDDWQKNDTETKATPCDNVYTVSSCKTTTTTDTDGKVTVAKACGKCDTDTETVKCVDCPTKGCNSATGLFSVLALTLAIIYQLL